MANRLHDIGIAGQIGTYSDAVETQANARWLVTAGTPGLDTYGKVPPDFGTQAELAWTHIVAMLKRADMTVHDLVKVTQYPPSFTCSPPRWSYSSAMPSSGSARGESFWPARAVLAVRSLCWRSLPHPGNSV